MQQTESVIHRSTLLGSLLIWGTAEYWAERPVLHTGPTSYLPYMKRFARQSRSPNSSLPAFPLGNHCLFSPFATLPLFCKEVRSYPLATLNGILNPAYYSSLHMYVCVLCGVSRSAVSDSVAPWTVAHQAPLSMEFPKQEYWSGLPFPSPVFMYNLQSIICIIVYT